jgi:hypothetical protein
VLKKRLLVVGFESLNEERLEVRWVVWGAKERRQTRGDVVLSDLVCCSGPYIKENSDLDVPISQLLTAS